jgi:hypothetical protein
LSAVNDEDLPGDIGVGSVVRCKTVDCCRMLADRDGMTDVRPGLWLLTLAATAGLECWMDGCCGCRAADLSGDVWCRAANDLAGKDFVHLLLLVVHLAGLEGQTAMHSFRMIALRLRLLTLQVAK